MQAAASLAWEFGNPCRWRRRPHGNLGIHAGGGVARMGIWGIHAGGGVTCMGIWESYAGGSITRMGIWESMQAAALPAWEFGNPCRWQGHPHGNLGIHAGGGVPRMEKIESPGT